MTASWLSAVTAVVPELMVSATLTVETGGQGFFEITNEVRDFVARSDAGEGMLFMFVRHTSASLVIQENADPDVRIDLAAVLDRLAPPGAGWIHDAEGPDDMPAHVKAMLTGVSLHIPVHAGAPQLGTWQGIYLAEHRTRPHRRQVALHYVGSRRKK
jgi:secondary thiamine-phosphate synthase enzyme